MNSTQRVVVSIWAVLSLAAFACGPSVAAPTPSATASSSPAAMASPTLAPQVTPTPLSAVTPQAVQTPTPFAALTPEMLRNAEYESDSSSGKKAKLTNGTYQEAAASGLSPRVVITMGDPYATGDFTGDGVADAAVILVTNSGGSGNYVELAAVVNEKGTPHHVASTALGDRVSMKSLAIQGQQIVAQFITHGPNDPLCCPTQEVTRRFRLIAGKLEPA